MERTIELDPNQEINFPETIPVAGEGITLLLPLIAPAIAWVVRAAVQAIARKQKANIEEQIDNREYLQQQNDMLLRQLLENRSEDPKVD